MSRGYTTHDPRFLASFVGAGWAPYHLPLQEERLDQRALPEGVESLTLSRQMDDVAEETRVDELRSTLGDLRPDVVIAGPIQTGAYVAASAGADPLVAVSWGSDVLVDADATAANRERTRYVFDHSALAFGDCRAVREAIKRHSELPDERIITFPWGIDLRLFQPGVSTLGLRQGLGWTSCHTFISTRTWEPVYAIDVLLDAFRLVLDRDDRARLILLGNGSQEREILGLIDSLDLATTVYAPGRVSQALLPDYFRESDVYVSSALSDGTSVSLLEAMACGLPVVVSNSYGNLEWVTPGTNGELAEPGNVASLARAMLSVAEDPSRRTEMGKRNVEVARSRADWDTNVAELVRRIEEVASR